LRSAGGMSRPPKERLLKKGGFFPLDKYLSWPSQLYVEGADVRWSAFGQSRCKVSLPTYPFQRQRYWAHTESIEYPKLTTPPEQAASAALNKSLYEVRWEKGLLREPTVDQMNSGPWLLLADDSGVAEELRRLLEQQGEICAMIAPGESLSLDGAHRVVSLRTLDDRPGEISSSLELICGGLLEIIQQISHIAKPPRLTLITRGSQTIGDAVADPVQAAAWLMGKVAELEHPEFWGGLIDVEPSESVETTARLIFQALTFGAEDQIAFRAGDRYVPRLRHYQPPVAVMEQLRFHSDATYWITGGIGSLGLETAKWMVAQGARNLVLIDIAEPSDAARGIVADMEQHGARIVVTRTDVSDRMQLEMVAQLHGLPELRGVIHCAGVLDDGAISSQHWDRFARVFAPKAVGAWNLHLATRDAHLDFFVLFSSVTSILGSPGQANYAAANAFLDALAHVRRREGLPATSINWGPWSDVGMAARLERRMSYLNLYGVGAIRPADGMSAFGQIVAHKLSQVTFLHLDIAALVESMPDILDSPFYSPLTAGLDMGAAPANPEVFNRILSASGGDRAAVTLAYLRAKLAEIVGLGPRRRSRPTKPIFAPTT
jgi:NAD(P)-dependent dehydrogenase (short-subunit alcohol dehydrogenase family)